MRAWFYSVIFCGVLLSSISIAQSAPSPVQPGKSWGKPEYSEYTAVNTSKQWRYKKNMQRLLLQRQNA